MHNVTFPRLPEHDTESKLQSDASVIFRSFAPCRLLPHVNHVWRLHNNSITSKYIKTQRGIGKELCAEAMLIVTLDFSPTVMVPAAGECIFREFFQILRALKPSRLLHCLIPDGYNTNFIEFPDYFLDYRSKFGIYNVNVEFYYLLVPAYPDGSSALFQPILLYKRLNQKLSPESPNIPAK